MDCQNEEGAMLTRDELCAQTKTYVRGGEGEREREEGERREKRG